MYKYTLERFTVTQWVVEHWHLLSAIIKLKEQGRIQDFDGGGGGGAVHKIMCAYTHLEPEARSPFWPEFIYGALEALGL